KFRFACKQESAALDKLLDQFITAVERARSFAGGGCDARGGEFYIETHRRVSAKDLLAMLGVWLPHVSALSLKAIGKEQTDSSAKVGRNGRQGKTITRARKHRPTAKTR